MLTPMQALQSALVKDIYQKGGETLSFMGAALSGGMLLGAFLYPFLAKRVAIDKALLLCGILNGGFYLVLAGCALIAQNIFFYPVLGFSSLVFGVSIGYLNTALAVMIMKGKPGWQMPFAWRRYRPPPFSYRRRPGWLRCPLS